jgi:adenosine/AMP kinase
MTAEVRAITLVPVTKPDDVNVILGQSHFIKSVEDIAEAVTGSVPGVRFGLAFSEARGACLIRLDGNDDALTALAEQNAARIAAGHTFILFLSGCFPINVLNAIKGLQEVCTIFCASANPVQVVVAESGQGRGILGVIDGASPRGTETPADVAERQKFLRTFGYKR